MNLLAFTPFVDGLSIDRGAWLLLFPMAFGIAVAYKAVRVKDFGDYWREVLSMTAQVSLAIVGLGMLTFLIIGYALPRLLG